jgi:DNA end-binding protein Ku
MARAIWTGVITFGLVSVPVALFTATEDHTVHFHQLQRDTADRVRNRRVNERTGDEVSSRDIVKGYELDEGDYVVVEPDELDSIAPGRSRTVDITDFVDLSDIEPVYFDRTYYVAPRGEEYGKVYELLRAALAGTGKAGIATVVMRNKQYLTALRAEADHLVMQTLHWADEVRDPARELPGLPAERAGRGKELDMAVRLIDAMSGPWEPERYHDTYRDRVRELVRDKAAGREIATAQEPPRATDVVDLMALLESSLDQAGGTGGEGRAGQRGEDAGRAKKPGRGTGRTAERGKGGSPGHGRGERPRGGREGAEGKDELHRLTKAELYRRATEQAVPGRSQMTREELIDALTGPERRRRGRGRARSAA